MTGCLHRSLTIRTNPPGAQIYVNDQLKGESPLTYDFLWYGWHRITLRKEGFVRQDDLKLLRSPVYLWIPFDLAVELLPFPVHDARSLDYTLTPASPLPAPVPPAVGDSKASAGAGAAPVVPGSGGAATESVGSASPAAEEPARPPSNPGAPP